MNRPATRTEVQALAHYEKASGTIVGEPAIIHHYPNREQRRAMNKSSFKHNNRKRHIHSTVIQRVEIMRLEPSGKFEKANKLGIKIPIFSRVPSGVFKDIIHSKNYRRGGARTSDGQGALILWPSVTESSAGYLKPHGPRDND